MSTSNFNSSFNSQQAKDSKKVVLVTGANKGIGFETVRLAAEQHRDWIILLGSRSQTNGEAAVKNLHLQNLTNVKLLLLDVDQDSSISSAAAQVRAQYGHLNFLVHNAAVLYPGATHENDVQTLHTNFFQVKKLNDAFLPLIPNDGTGKIVIVSSVVGAWAHDATPAPTRAILDNVNTLTYKQISSLATLYLASKLPPHFPGRELFNPQDPALFHGTSYGASKLFLSAYGRVLARDLKQRNIPVIIVCPGYCATDMTVFSGVPERTSVDGALSLLATFNKTISDTGKFFQDDIEQPTAFPVNIHEQGKPASANSKLKAK